MVLFWGFLFGGCWFFFFFFIPTLVISVYFFSSPPWSLQFILFHLYKWADKFRMLFISRPFPFRFCFTMAWKQPQVWQVELRCPGTDPHMHVWIPVRICRGHQRLLMRKSAQRSLLSQAPQILLACCYAATNKLSFEE